jgi:biotin carboxyl carrier protein
LGKEKKLRRLSDGKLHSVRVEKLDGSFRVSASEPELEATVVRASESSSWSVVTAGGRSFEAAVERRDGEIHVEVEHRRFVFAAGDSRVEAGRGGPRGGRVEVKAPMPGKVVKVLVAPGERVSAGQPVLLFEAMKMQNELRSPQDGTVVSMDVETGQAVESRERLYVVDSRI